MTGIKIDGHLTFADDIVPITGNVEELQEMLNEFNEASKAVGVHINFKKTQVMANGGVNQDSEITDQQIANESRQDKTLTLLKEAMQTDC